MAFAAVAPLVLLGTAPRANAATSCYESSCAGLQAASTTCVNDGEVIYQVNIHDGSAVVGNVELKYSPSCRVTWARVISNLPYGEDAQIASNNNPNLWATCTGNHTAGTGCNTPMINDANMTSYAFGDLYDANGNYFYAQTPSF
jgi:hypothetical protein